LALTGIVKGMAAGVAAALRLEVMNSEIVVPHTGQYIDLLGGMSLLGTILAGASKNDSRKQTG